MRMRCVCVCASHTATLRTLRPGGPPGNLGPGASLKILLCSAGGSVEYSGSTSSSPCYKTRAVTAVTAAAVSPVATTAAASVGVNTTQSVQEPQPQPQPQRQSQPPAQPYLPLQVLAFLANLLARLLNLLLPRQKQKHISCTPQYNTHIYIVHGQLIDIPIQ